MISYCIPTCSYAFIVLQKTIKINDKQKKTFSGKKHLLRATGFLTKAILLINMFFKRFLQRVLLLCFGRR